MTRFAAAIVVSLVVSACGSAVAAQPEPVRTCPVGSMVVVIGDSITVQSADELSANLTAAGYVPAINAHTGRHVLDGIEPARGYVQFGGPRCWVIALGTNDVLAGDPGIWEQMIGNLLEQLPAGEPVQWMRVAVTGGELFNRLVTVPLIDWRPTAADLDPDHIHLSVSGEARWAAAVALALQA